MPGQDLNLWTGDSALTSHGADTGGLGGEHGEPGWPLTPTPLWQSQGHLLAFSSFL